MTNAVKPTLFFEFVGSEVGVAEQMETVEWCMNECNVINFDGTSDAADRAKLWKARHMAYYASTPYIKIEKFVCKIFSVGQL